MRAQLRWAPRSPVLAAASGGGYHCRWCGTEKNRERQEKLRPAETEGALCCTPGTLTSQRSPGAQASPQGSQWRGVGASEPQTRCCQLNSVPPTQWRATGPCRTRRALTWCGHRSCWDASGQCSAWSWTLW